MSVKQALFSGLFDGTSDEVRFDQAGGFLAQARVLADATEIEVPTDDGFDDLGDVAGELDVERPADRRTDRDARSEPAPVPERRPAAAAPAIAPRRDRAPVEIPPADVAALFGAVRVARTPSGGLTLEASPEAAASLAALLSGMASLLGQAAPAGSPTRSA